MFVSLGDPPQDSLGHVREEVRKSMPRALVHGNDLNIGFAPDEVVLIAFCTYLSSSLAGPSFPSSDKDIKKQETEQRELKRHNSAS